jgi:hypothetical protein
MKSDEVGTTLKHPETINQPHLTCTTQKFGLFQQLYGPKIVLLQQLYDPTSTASSNSSMALARPLPGCTVRPCMACSLAAWYGLGTTSSLLPCAPLSFAARPTSFLQPVALFLSEAPSYFSSTQCVLCPHPQPPFITLFPPFMKFLEDSRNSL